MMLTHERLAGYREQAKGIGAFAELLAHIDTQQARIADIEAQNTSLLYLLAQIREACGDNGKRMQDELVAYIGDLAKDAARYRWLRDLPEGSKYEEIGNYPSTMWNESIDAAMQPTWPEDTSDYGSRIAVIGQNGNDGLSYKEQK